MYLRRWSPRSKLFAISAVLAGVAAFSLVRGYEERLRALRPVTGDPVPVVVAARDLARGAVLTPEAVRIQTVPSAFAPPGRVSALEQVEGRTLVSDLAEGEAVTDTRIGVRGGPVASLVPSGLRAFAIPAGVPPGTLRAGDRVDVLATFGGPRPYTDTVASGLEVLLIVEDDGEVFEAGGGGTSLLLLVDPGVAERLAYAAAFADLTVVVAPAEGA